MKRQKSYFENEDSEICYPLSYHIANAKEEGLEEIELIEAIPDKVFCNEYTWCSLVEAVGDKSECNKLNCADYEKPEKGRICQHRGKLMGFGNSVKFDVKTCKKLTKTE